MNTHKITVTLTVESDQDAEKTRESICNCLLGEQYGFAQDGLEEEGGEFECNFTIVESESDGVVVRQG